MRGIYKNMDLKKIIISYLRDEISEEDKFILEDWLVQDRKNRDFLRSFEDESYISNSLKEFSNYDPDEGWYIVSESIKPQKRIGFKILLRYVAILLVIFGSWGIIKYVTNDFVSRTEFYQKKLSDIISGKPKALLILENGKEIKLEEVKDTSINIAEGLMVINSDKSVSYVNKGRENSSLNETKAKWHTIKIPRGGEYMLLLSDGTKVWLNSDTEIKYPSEFSGKTREVFLKGEAYFDVEKNPKKPFIVNTSKMDIKVLGTSFNVMAYDEEDSMHTTLVEGLVEIRAEGVNSEPIKIYPGQQAMLERNKFKVRKVNTKLYSAWKDGRFAFNSEQLEKVVRKLSRWYNVEFFFMNNSLKERRFTGNIPKYQDISKVVDMLEYTSGVRFSIKNNSIVIREK